MAEFGIHTNERAIVIDGADFDPQLIGFTEPTSENKAFNFFYLLRE
jgi:hypothetical protein